MAASPVYPGAPKNPVITIVNADGTAKKTLYTAGASGAKIGSLSVASDDTAAHDIQVWLTKSAVDYLVATIAVAAGAGNTSGVVQLNMLPLLLSLMDPAGFLLLEASAILKVNAVVAVTAAKTMYFTGTGADF